MRIKEPQISDRTGRFIAIPLVIITAPAWLLLAALIGLVWLKRRLIGPHAHWSRWFAWYPVRVDWDEWRWLEMIDRQSKSILGDVEYCASKGSSDE